MRLLNGSTALWRVLAAAALALALIGAGVHGNPVWGEETQEDAATDTAAETQDTSAEEGAAAADQGETGTDESAEGEAGDEESAEDQGGEEESAPEGVRRSRPRTAEQERLYKQRKTREDPFLNQPAPGPVEYVYNPADALQTEVSTGVSRYMVQDGDGAVVGYTTLAVELEVDPVLGEFVRLRRLDEFEPRRQQDLWLYAETLKPRLKEVVQHLPNSRAPVPEAPGDASAGQGNSAVEVVPLYRDTQRLSADYLFDRVKITHRAGGITASRTLRGLPYSYDIDELPLIVRQLRFNEAQWPFEAAICDPAREANLAVAIEQPLRVADVLSAEPATYRCFEVVVRLGDEFSTYWVERLPPRRVVRFTDSEYTYTLLAYGERP